MCLGGPSIPAATAPPATAKVTDPAVVAAMDRERQHQAAAGGRQSTILAGGSGLTMQQAPLVRTVLGQ